MKLNPKYKYVILAEDNQTKCFIRFILRNNGVENRKMRFIPTPEGCGEQFVRIHLVDEIKILRSTNYDRRKVLIAVTDADVNDVENRVRMLEDECISRGVDWRKNKELIAIFVPKRNIETWIHAYADGFDNIDETTDYRHNYGAEKKCRSYAIEMSEDLMADRLKNNNHSSLQYAQKEYDRICSLQMQIN